MRIEIQNLNVDELQSLIEKSIRNALEQKEEKKEPTTELLTRKEVAKFLGISLVTLNTWTKHGKLPALRIGTRVRYNKADVISSLKKIETLKYGRA